MGEKENGSVVKYHVRLSGWVYYEMSTGGNGLFTAEQWEEKKKWFLSQGCEVVEVENFA